GKAGALVDAGVGPGVRCEDHSGIERNRDTVGHLSGGGKKMGFYRTGMKSMRRREEVAADAVAERRDPLEKIHQVLVQAVLDDGVGAAVVQLGMELARGTLHLA